MAHGAFSRMGGTRAYVLARGRAETTVDATEHCDSKTRLPVLPVRETALKKCYAPSAVQVHTVHTAVQLKGVGEHVGEQMSN